MANENETVAEVCREISCSHEGIIGIELGCFAARIHAAHKREIDELKKQVSIAKDAEIAELQECLQEAVEWSCGNPDESCGDCVAHGGDTPCKCEKWRKALKNALEV